MGQAGRLTTPFVSRFGPDLFDLGDNRVQYAGQLLGEPSSGSLPSTKYGL